MENSFITADGINVAGLRECLFQLPDAKARKAFLLALGETYEEMKRRAQEILIDERDYQVYSVVKFGDAYWMGENLLFDVDGSMVNPEFPTQDYGRLYDFAQMEQAAPAGWHVASDDEWNALEILHGSSKKEVAEQGSRGEAGYKLASESWIGCEPGRFKALPAGYYLAWTGGGDFYAFGEQAGS